MGRFFVAANTTSWKIGPAPVTPEVSRMGELSALPTHTPTMRSGVKPTVQLSREFLVVPVLAATGKSKVSGPPSPNSERRAEASLRISVMSQATLGSRMCAPFFVGVGGGGGGGGGGGAARRGRGRWS